MMMDIFVEEIYQFGVVEVDCIYNEMCVIMIQVGFEGLLQDFFEFMWMDEQFYYLNMDEGCDVYFVDVMVMIDIMVEMLLQMFNCFL